MAYKIRYQRQAIEDAKRLKQEEPKAFEKLLKLEAELKDLKYR
jgi:mRNA-degrading endonuclease RelE of RelBE toxin-antitoxin system